MPTGVGPVILDYADMLRGRIMGEAGLDIGAVGAGAGTVGRPATL